MDVLWNIVSFVGLVILTLAGIGTCILLVYSIVCIVKQVKEEFRRD